MKSLHDLALRQCFLKFQYPGRCDLGLFQREPRQFLELSEFAQPPIGHAGSPEVEGRPSLSEPPVPQSPASVTFLLTPKSRFVEFLEGGQLFEHRSVTLASPNFRGSQILQRASSFNSPPCDLGASQIDRGGFAGGFRAARGARALSVLCTGRVRSSPGTLSR